MRLKKVLSLLAVSALAGSLFTGCGDTNKTSENQNVKLGMITTLNASEQKVEEILKQFEEKSNVKLLKHNITFYKNLSTMQMGLESTSIDEMSTYDCVANYLMAKKLNLHVVDNHGMALSDSFCFAVLKSNEGLKKDLDKSLDNLIKQYITDVKAEDPQAVELPRIDDADTIKVAVTGDLPPLDLVLANGQPAGFNTALLAEIGKRLNKNIEIIDIDGDARSSALTSGRADVIFWAILPVDDRPKDIDTPEGAVLSEPYFTDKITHLKANK